MKVTIMSPLVRLDLPNGYVFVTLWDAFELLRGLMDELPEEWPESEEEQ